MPDDNEILEEFGGALPEELDDRDFIAGNISWISDLAAGELPKVVRFPHEAVLLESQGTSVSCTAQAATNALEIEYYRATGKIVKVSPEIVSLLEGKIAIIDAMAQWELQKKHPATATSNGDYVRSALDALLYWSKQLGGIPAKDKAGNEIRITVISYAKIEKTNEDIQRYVSQGKAIITSCDVTKNANGISNFHIAKTTGILRIVGARIGGHAWILGGYDMSGAIEPHAKIKEFYVAGNSYGEGHGFFKNGSFILPKDEIKNISTPWVIFIDESDLKERIFLDVGADDWAAEQIKLALADGIMIGEDSGNINDPKDRKFSPDRAITRRELAVVYSRIKKVLG